MKKVYKVIIAGTRSFIDFKLLCKKCDKILSILKLKGKIIIVCGKARGADMLGKRYAELRGYAIEYFPYLKQFGKVGGMLRNTQMAKFATHCITFWDDISRGTNDMIEKAIRFLGKPRLRVIHYKKYYNAA